MIYSKRNSWTEQNKEIEASGQSCAEQKPRSPHVPSADATAMSTAKDEEKEKRKSSPPHPEESSGLRD